MSLSHFITFTLLHFLTFTLLHAQELREMQYEELSADRIILDISFVDESVLIVESTIPNLVFASTRGIKPGSVSEKEPGEWWIVLEPGVHLIDIMAEGYRPIKNIRHNFQPQKVWRLKVTAGF